jgi:hypothetical protein
MIDRTPATFSMSEKGWRSIGALIVAAICSYAPWWISWRIICSCILVGVGYVLGRIAWRFVSTRSERHIIKEKRRAANAALLNSQRANENGNFSDRKNASDALHLATKAYSAALTPAEKRLNRILERRPERAETRANLVGLLVFALAVAPFTFLPWEQHAAWAVAIFAVSLAIVVVVVGTVLLALMWTPRIPTP